MSDQEKALREVGKDLPEDIKDRLRDLHKDFWSCAAWSEGQTCCIEYLTGDADE